MHRSSLHVIQCIEVEPNEHRRMRDAFYAGLNQAHFKIFINVLMMFPRTGNMNRV